MLDNQRVVAFTPYGRRVTVSILYEYMKRDHERGLLDEWMLCMNVDPDQGSDVAFAKKLERENDWIKRYQRPTQFPHRTPKQLNTGQFYTYMTDPNSVYLRFDDDIVYVHEDAIENMARRAIQSEQSLGTFPIIWNNAICTWHLQVREIVPYAWGHVQPYCMDPVGWADGHFAVNMHNLLLDKIATDDVKSLFMYQDVQLPIGLQFSVSCFAVHGRDYLALNPPGVLDYEEEEHWLTVHRPAVVGKSNVIAGDSLVSHYTFYPQREVVGATDILERYRKVAKEL
jgi:hypothetical protein